MTRKRRELGAAGEALAADWYQSRGYDVLARNWRCPRGELDLVLRAPDGSLVFSEVKSRTSGRFGSPAEAVTPEKQQRIRALALEYLRRHPRPGATRRARRSDPGRGASGGIRFDIVSVLRGEVDVAEGAF